MAPTVADFIPLSTKVTLPRRRSDMLSRPRLVDFLREQIDRHLFLIVAPAAYGKTTCLVDFAYQTQLPSCYLRLDTADRDLRTFLRYLIASI